MNKVSLVARLLLGGVFLVFGLNFFLNFLPTPPPETEVAKSFITALAMTPNYFAIVKVIEIVAGAFILLGVFLPLGLVLLGPILTNIVIYNSYLNKTPGIDLALLVCFLFLMWTNRKAFKPLFTK